MAEKINTIRSLTKELKLKVAQFFYDRDKNCNQTATHFKVWRKQVGIVFILLLSFYLFYSCYYKFFVHIAFHASYWTFLLNPSNNNFFAHNCDVYHFRLFRSEPVFDKLKKYRLCSHFVDRFRSEILMLRNDLSTQPANVPGWSFHMWS